MLQILSIGCGEGGSKLASSMVELGANVLLINTNKNDLDSVVSVRESSKLLLNISDGGSGKNPLFIEQSLKNQDTRNRIKDFIKKTLDNAPLFSYCPNCQSKVKILDTELVGDTHACSNCNYRFGLIDILKDDSIKHNYIFLFVGLGGGSGSGLITNIIDICRENFNIPIGVVATLPDENEDLISKTNALSVFKKLYNEYATSGFISPLILCDNQKMMETYNVPMGSMYSTINRAITKSIDRFNRFSDKVSKNGMTVDVMDTARLWSLGGCAQIGSFYIGNESSSSGAIRVPHPLALDEIDAAIANCTFVDGFQLDTAKGVGVIAVGPSNFLDDPNMSAAIRYTYSKVKELIGDGLVLRGSYVDDTLKNLEFHIFLNGLTYPETKINKMWEDIKSGKVIAKKKNERMDSISYDVSIESDNKGNFLKLQNNSLGTELLNEAPTNREQPRQVDKIKRKVACPNCIQDPMTKASLGIYKKGGPNPFEGKICVKCGGRGHTLE